MPTPPSLQPIHFSQLSLDIDIDDDDLLHTYHSPPFKEADFPHSRNTNGYHTRGWRRRRILRFIVHILFVEETSACETTYLGLILVSHPMVSLSSAWFSPPTLLVLSSTTLQTLYIVLPTLLEPFSPLPHHYYYSASATATTNASTSSSTTLGPPTTSPTNIAPSTNVVPDDNYRVGRRDDEPPRPVYALSRRLLVHASPSPFSVSSPPLSVPTTSPRTSKNSNPNTSPSLPSSNPLGGGLSSTSTTVAGTIGMVGRKATNMTQAELGHAAMKVGECFWDG